MVTLPMGKPCMLKCHIGQHTESIGKGLLARADG